MVPVSYGLVSNGANIADAVSFLGRTWNSAKPAMAISCFFLPGWNHLTFLSEYLSSSGRSAEGCADEELQVEGAGGLSVDVCPRRERARCPSRGPGRLDIGTLLWFCYRLFCEHQQLWKLPSVPSSLLPKPFALQNCCRVWFTKVLWGLGCKILWQKKAFWLFITSHILNSGKLV